MIYSSKAKTVNPDIDNESENIDIFDVELRPELNLYGYILNLKLVIVYLVAFFLGSEKVLNDERAIRHVNISFSLASLFLVSFHAYVLYKKDLEKTKLNSGLFARILKAWPLILGTFFYALFFSFILIKNERNLDLNYSWILAFPMFTFVVNVSETKFESWSNTFKPWIIKEKNSQKFYQDFNLFAFILNIIVFLLTFGLLNLEKKLLLIFLSWIFIIYVPICVSPWPFTIKSDPVSDSIKSSKV